MEFIYFITFVAIYLAPAIIANRRKAKKENLISMVNFLFGWTVIGWFLALAWACDAEVKVKNA